MMDDEGQRLPIVSLGLMLVLLSACTSQPATSIAPPISPTPTGAPLPVASDIVYASSLLDEGISWKLDIYTPNQAGNWPVVVFIHPDGATKEGYIKESQAIAENGAVVYTLTWPTWIHDLAARENGKGYREMSEALACGVRFAMATASDYNADLNHVTLVAFHGGGYLGIWFALASNTLDTMWEDFFSNNDGPPSQVVCERSLAPIKVDAFIGIGGSYLLTEKLQESNLELWNIVSPIAHLGRDLGVYIRLLHGEHDDESPLENSQMMNDILLREGYDTQLIMFDGGHDVPTQFTADLVIQLVSERQE